MCKGIFYIPFLYYCVRVSLVEYCVFQYMCESEINGPFYIARVAFVQV